MIPDFPLSRALLRTFAGFRRSHRSMQPSLASKAHLLGDDVLRHPKHYASIE